MKKTFIQPTGDRVLIKRDDPVTEKNGFKLPEQSIEKPSEGIIVAVGPKVIANNAEAFAAANSDMACGLGLDTFYVGDKVTFGKWSGVEITVNENETYVLLKADEIFNKLVEVEVPDEPADPKPNFVETETAVL